MQICIVAGKGYGKTTLSAFDAALKDAGIHNYNLIYLSSIIPPGAKVIRRKKYGAPEDEYGHRLYIVKAETRTEETGKAIAAGLGWYQNKDGRGVFVEHVVKAETVKTAKEGLEFKIKNSLRIFAGFENFPTKKVTLKRPLALAKLKISQAVSWSPPFSPLKNGTRENSSAIS